MKRAFCLGAGLDVLSASLLELNIYLMLRIPSYDLLYAGIIDAVFAVGMAFLYIRFAKGSYWKTIFVWIPLSFVVFVSVGRRKGKRLITYQT